MTSLRLRAVVAFAAGLELFAFAGCGPMHGRGRVTIDVVDGMTGLPAAGTVVRQDVPTRKFERPVSATAVADEHGVATLNAITWSERPTIWWIGEEGLAYECIPPLEVPREFRRVASDDGTPRYIAARWPRSHLRIEVAPDYRGPVAEWPLEQPAPPSDPWMPPASTPGGEPGPGDQTRDIACELRTALARPDANGVVAYPTTFAGRSGFAFSSNRVLVVDGRPLPVIDASEDLRARSNRSPGVVAGQPYDRAAVYAWVIAHDGEGRGELSDPGRWGTRVWFVGTESELRGWFVDLGIPAVGSAASVTPVAPQAGSDDLFSRARVVRWVDLDRGLQRPTSPSAGPRWETAGGADADS